MLVAGGGAQGNNPNHSHNNTRNASYGAGQYQRPQLQQQQQAWRTTMRDPAQLAPIALPINYTKDSELIGNFVGQMRLGKDKVGFEARPLADSELGEAAMVSLTAEEGGEEQVTALAKSRAIGSFKYLKMLQEIADLKRTAITIDLDDLLQFDEQCAELAGRIMRNTHRYATIFAETLDRLLPEPSVPIDMANMDVIDVIASHRRARQQRSDDPQQQNGPQESDPDAQANKIPASLLRRFAVYFAPSLREPVLAVRNVHATHVGALVRIKGIITRVTEVKPLLAVGTYTCERCGYEVYQEITTQAFLPLPECPSDACRRNMARGQLQLQTRGSRFYKFQEARIQELADQVPMGHIPRTMAVWLMGDLTRTVSPGDHVILAGIYTPKPYTGYKAIRAGLLTDTYLQAMHIEHLKGQGAVAKAKKGPPDHSLNTVADSNAVPIGNVNGTTDMTERVNHLAQDPLVYARLARSIAPEIYGHEDVKKALLLLLVGGATKTTADGMTIRGDINICLMGDPGVAKSQLLKHIAEIAPRAIYTTGKGSSGVGLTASVARDPLTNEMMLEAGALVLADNGICCIDEFDKMDELDRTAIHEAMEQQTISISKAGITTTLNARTSILAAANPLYGRYNPKRSPRENINLPPALLSRFDLLFLLLDQADLENDTRLAEHICYVHRTGQPPPPSALDGDAESIVEADLFRAYIATARQYQPEVPSTSLADYIVGAYVGLRLNDLNQKESTYTTPRTLLAVLRLSQALARLRLSNTINQADIDEAIRLVEVSRSSVNHHLTRNPRSRTDADPATKILSIIRDLARRLVSDGEEKENDGQARTVPMDLIREATRGRGFSDEQLQQCLVAFDQCNIWSVSADGTSLKIFN